jgi:small-conductance mechanosensitive channel
MGIGVSIFLIAVGAVLLFALGAQQVGAILLIVGVLGLVVSFVFWGPQRQRAGRPPVE